MPTLMFDVTTWPDHERWSLTGTIVFVAYNDVTPRVNTEGITSPSFRQQDVGGTTHTFASVTLPNATDVSSLTETVVRNRYATNKAAQDAANAAHDAEVAACQAFAPDGDADLDLKIGDIVNYFQQTDAQIAAAGNAAQYRAAMGRIQQELKYLMKFLYNRQVLGPR